MYKTNHRHRGMAFAITAMIVCGCTTVSQQKGNEKELSFCNPVQLPYRFVSDASYREAADPTVIRYGNGFLLFASHCGEYYYSDNLVDWNPIKSNLETLVMRDSMAVIECYAPTVVEAQGRYYYMASTATKKVYVTTNPIEGKWILMDGAGTANDLNDPMLLYTKDKKMYVFWGSSCSADDWLSGQQLDLTTMTPAGDIVNLTNCRKDSLGWEVPGDYNDQPERNPWLEGVWVTERQGRYYLQYAGPGTEAKSYGDAVYTSSNPLGPYKVQSTNPAISHPEGFIAAAGHGSTVEDKYGNWWHFSTGTISRRHIFERRLVMHPVFFDSDGEMYGYTAFGDWPIRIPNKKIDNPDELHSGWMLLSYNKPTKASSQKEGHPAELAVNEDIRSWWSAKGEKGEWLMVDLQAECNVAALQVNIADEDATDRAPSRATATYKIEYSSDGENFKSLDAKVADIPHNFISLEKPIEARYVRVTSIEVPSGEFSISGLRIFGNNPTMAMPKGSTITTCTRLDDKRRVQLNWQKVEGATGYNIRYGASPNKLYLTYQVLGADNTQLQLNNLNAHSDYYFAIDVFNEAGVTQGKDIIKLK